MLVKVKHKETGKESLITPRAYDLAKKRYLHLGTVNDNEANLHGAKVKTPEPKPPITTTVAEIPNQQPQAEKESGAAHADNPVGNKPAKGKPGPKSKKQISSQSETAEV